MSEKYVASIRPEDIVAAVLHEPKVSIEKTAERICETLELYMRRHDLNICYGASGLAFFDHGGE